MFQSQLFECFIERLRASSEEVLVSFSKCLDGLQILLAIACEGIGEDFVQRGGGGLPVALGVLVELGCTLG
jgi:hypothetical protein